MKLVEIRKKRAWSQRKFSLNSGVGQGTISAIERGLHAPHSYRTARKVAGALGVDVLDIDEFGDIAYVPGNPAHPKALKIIMEACYRLGINRQEFCRRSHIQMTSLNEGINGLKTLDRTRVGRLASVAEAPELLDGETLPFKNSRYLLTCRGCDRQKSFTAHIVRNCCRDYQLNEKEGTGSYECHTCELRARGKKEWETAKKKGKKQAVLAHLDEMRLMRDPEKLKETARANIRAYHEKGNSEAHNENIALAKIRPRPKRFFWVCPLCPYLNDSKKSDSIGIPHSKCWKDLLSKHPEMAFLPYPPSRKGQVPAPEKLAMMVEIFVRHRLKAEPIEGGTGLAQEFQITPQGARKWIRELLMLMPPDDRGGERLERWATTIKGEL